MKHDTNVVWKYIDTEKATQKAMRDYPDMKKLEFILTNNTKHQKEFDISRLNRVKDYLNWFEPAWCTLNSEEQLILTEFYMQSTLKSGAGVRLQFKLSYSERQLHRLRGDAISKLSLLLFAK